MAGATVGGGVSPANAESASQTYFTTTQTPATPLDADRSGVELGMKFGVKQAGEIESIRFFKGGTANSGTHTGSIWNSSGARLAQVTFAAETASGWQQAHLAVPLSVTAGRTYVVSYHAPAGRYSATNRYFNTAKTSGLIETPINAGTYRYGAASGFPSTSYQSSNYWIDVILSTVTTPTPIPTPTPPSTGFPSAANTGVPAGTVLRDSDSLTVTTPGTIIDSLNVRGSINVNASNVTVKRTRITGSAWSLIRVKDGVTGVKIEDVEIDGLGKSGAGNSMGVMGPASVSRADITGVENGLTPGSGSVLEGNYVHGLTAPGSPHIDGVQIDGGLSAIRIDHNTIDMREWKQTSAVMIDNYFGPINNVAVNNNLLMGGGYTVYSDGQFTGGTIQNVSFTNNRLGRGHWGYASVVRNTPAWTNNVDHTTGAVVDR